MSAKTKKSERRGILFVVSAPSGGGKTTLVKGALSAETELSLSVSLTTREPRVGEVDGVDYLFVTPEEFARRRAGGEVAEWAQVFDHFYGTPRAPLDAAIASGRDVLLDVDFQGAQSLKRIYGGDAVGIFVVPPSLAALEERLRARGTDSEQQIRRRLDRVEVEMREGGKRDVYDYRIVNQDRDRAIAELRAIFLVERLRLRRLGPLRLA